MWTLFVGSKLKTKLLTMTGVSVGFFLAYALVSNNTLAQLKVNGPVYVQIVQGKDLVADILPPPEYIIESYLVCLQMLGAKDAAEQKQLIDRMTALKSDYDTRHEFWIKDLSEGKMKEVLIQDSYTPAIAFYQLVNGSFIPAIQAGDKAKATELAFGSMRTAYEQHRAAIDQVVTMANQRGADTEKEAAATVASRSLWLWIIAIGGIALAATLAWTIQNLIVRSLTQASESLDAGACLVASTASQLSASSQSLSAGATEQASSLEQTCSTLDTMSGMTQKNVSSTQAASELADLSKRSIVKNVEQMKELQTAVELVHKTAGEMNESMQAIKASSDSIGQIMKTIDEIAFQTNILALNAAVEAARAGEAGMGFAVVADEVRTLAHRCSKASNETSTIIQESIRRSSTGMQVNTEVLQSLTDIHLKAKQVDEGLQEVLRHSERMGEVVGEIASASNEQSAETRQISSALQEIGKVTQSSAANAEQAASAAEELNVESQELKAAVEMLTSMVNGRPIIREIAPTASPSSTQWTAPKRNKTEAAAVVEN